LDVNKDGKIHYWELKNFFKFRDYSRISGLEDLEYRSGSSQYNFQATFPLNNKSIQNEKSLLDHKYPSKNNINYNYKPNKNNFEKFSNGNYKSPSSNSGFNFNEIHNEIEEKIGTINKLIQNDKSKQEYIENQVKFINEAENVKKYIGNEFNKINNPNAVSKEPTYNNNPIYNCKNNSKDIDLNNKNDQLNRPKNLNSINPVSTIKFLNNFNNNPNVNQNINERSDLEEDINNKGGENLSKFDSKNSNNNNLEDKKTISGENFNKSKKFSNSKFGFAAFEEIKNNNTYGIKLNLEEEIFLQFLVDLVQLNKETEAIKNDLARKYDFSILKLFKIFQDAEEEIEVFNHEKNLIRSNYKSPIEEYRERTNYPNTFNLTNKFNQTNKSFSSLNNTNDEKNQNQQQSFNMSYFKSFPIGRKNKENVISKYAFKKILNTMDIYPTLIELKLVLNRFNNKEADFR